MRFTRLILLSSICAAISGCAHGVKLPLMTTCVSDPIPTNPTLVSGLSCVAELPNDLTTDYRKPYRDTKGYVCFPPDLGKAFFDACGARIRAK